MRNIVDFITQELSSCSLFTRPMQYTCFFYIPAPILNKKLLEDVSGTSNNKYPTQKIKPFIDVEVLDLHTSGQIPMQCKLRQMHQLH